jgi:nitrite reductase (NADH) small subunit
MATHIVARAEEIPHGGRKIVRLEGREVGIFNLEGTFYALKNVCPHQGARVCLGRIVGTTLPSDVYEFNYGLEGRILRCPWHEWEYDITTGHAVFDEKVRVVTYAVEVVDGEIAVTIGSERAAAGD